jgi:hypothetical protein
MKKTTAVSVLFVVAAAYDGLLGLGFLFAAGTVFQWAQVSPPSHLGYVQFPAALLIVFAIMFLAIAGRPRENRRLIPYGILLKVSYCGVAIYHWSTSGIPGMWKPFVVCDFVFIALFALAYLFVSKPESP